MSFAKILSKYLGTEYGQKAALARSLDVSIPYIVDLAAGRKKAPNINRCHQIADALELSKEQEDQLINAAIAERVRPEELHVLRSKHAPLPTPDLSKRVVILPWEDANKKITADDIQIGLEHVTATCEVNENSFALRIEEDSMDPEFRQDDIVIINECSPQNDDFLLIANKQEKQPMIRQYKDLGKTKILHPINSKFKDEVFDKYHIIVGKVAETIRKY